MEQNLCRLLHRAACCIQPFYTTVSPCTLTGRCYTPAAYPKCRLHNKLTQSHIKLYENLTYTPHAARGYRSGKNMGLIILSRRFMSPVTRPTEGVGLLGAG